MATYFKTDTRTCPLVPAKLVERQSDGRVTLEITRTTHGQDTTFVKGHYIHTLAEHFVEKCGKQRGEWIGNLFDGPAVYVRPVR